MRPQGAGLSTENRAPHYSREKAAALQSFVDFGSGGLVPAWPLEVFLEVSNVCDLKCAMCPTFSALNPDRYNILQNNQRGLLAIERATTPMEPILQHALIVHAFGYGEPTIHPQFREFIQFISRFEVMVDFFSHGMHLTQDMCEFLVQNRVVRITISFSGATREDYENVYLGGDFQRVLKGIKTLAATKEKHGSDYPSIDVNSLGFKHHVEKLPEFVRLMGEHGVNVIHLKPLQTYDQIRELHAHTSVMRPAVEGPYLDRAKQVAAEYGINLASVPYEQTTGGPARSPDDSVQARHKGEELMSTETVPITELKNIAKSLEKKSEQRRAATEFAAAKEQANAPSQHAGGFVRHGGVPCMEPFKTLYASFNGKTYPCCFKMDSGEPLGDLGRSSGLDIWQGTRAASIQQHILQGEYPADLCSNCLKANTFPKSHNLAMKLNQYARWYQHVFDTPFDQALVQAVRRLPDNASIIKAHDQLVDRLS